VGPLAFSMHTQSNILHLLRTCMTQFKTSRALRERKPPSIFLFCSPNGNTIFGLMQICLIWK